jgi:hypothetical protein
LITLHPSLDLINHPDDSDVSTHHTTVHDQGPGMLSRWNVSYRTQRDYRYRKADYITNRYSKLSTPNATRR